MAQPSLRGHVAAFSVASGVSTTATSTTVHTLRLKRRNASIGKAELAQFVLQVLDGLLVRLGARTMYWTRNHSPTPIQARPAKESQ